MTIPITGYYCLFYFRDGKKLSSKYKLNKIKNNKSTFTLDVLNDRWTFCLPTITLYPPTRGVLFHTPMIMMQSVTRIEEAKQQTMHERRLSRYGRRGAATTSSPVTSATLDGRFRCALDSCLSGLFAFSFIFRPSGMDDNENKVI